MCDGIEYFLDGERRFAVYGSTEERLPIVQPRGALAFYQWGAHISDYHALDNTPGWGAKFPRTGWAPLEEIRAHKWMWLSPRPVRIMASRFGRIDRALRPRSIALKPGEFIQGLLAELGRHQRVYVVTVPPPAELAGWENWPRIVRQGNLPCEKTKTPRARR